MSKKIKLSVGLILGTITLFGFFAVATPVSAMTCNSATITGEVITGTPPTRARFTYGTSYNTVANGNGTPTVVQTFYTNGTFPIQQFISGLSESTTYYYRLEVTNNYGTKYLNIENFTTPACQTQSNPNVSLTADDTNLNYGDSTILRWTPTNATSCIASGDWSGTKSTYSNSQSTGNLTSTKTYIITCSGASGTTPATDSVTVNVGQQTNVPSVTLTADDTNIDYGTSTILRWTTNNNPTSCIAEGAWSGSKNIDGGYQSTGNLYSTKNYSITCSNNAGSNSAFVTVVVGEQQGNLPTVDLNADNTNINYGASTILRWSSQNADTCVASGAWYGNRDRSSTESTGPLTSNKTYILTCSNSRGSNFDSVTVNVGNNDDDGDSPDVTTENATDIEEDEAVLNGFVDGNGSSTRVWFEYGEDRDDVEDGDADEITSSQSTGSGTDDFERRITGLDGDTTYYFRAVAENENGTDYGSVRSFRTDDDGDNDDDDDESPDVTTKNATSVGNTNATLNGRVDGNGRSVRAWFEYGTTYSLGYATSEKSYGSGSTSYDRSITGLLPNTTYYFRAIAENSADTVYGDILSFRTKTNYIPPIENNQPTVGIAADSTNLAYNGATTIRWFTTNATSCSASGGSIGWAGAKNIGPGSFYTGSLTSAKTYTIACYNSFGSSADSVTVNVRGQIINPPNPTPSSLVLITSSIDRNQPILPTIDNTNPRPGDEINYTITYQNIGTGSITNLNLRVDLPYEVDYMFSNPSNPSRSGNTLIFSLGTLRANGTGTVTIRVRVRESATPGAYLNFPAVLSYVDPSGQPQSVSANVSAQVWRDQILDVEEKTALTANVFGAGFLPTNLFGWLLLFILILILILLARYLFSGEQPFSKKTTTITHH